MAGEDFLKFNSGEKFSFSNLKEIKEEDLKNADAETKRLFNIFAGGKDVLKADDLWNKLKNAAATNSNGDNSVFDDEEMQNFLDNDSDIKAGSANSKFSINTLINLISQICALSKTTQADTLQPQNEVETTEFTSEEIKNISIELTSGDVNKARELYNNQNDKQGNVKKFFNATKENFDTKFASSRVGRAIRKEELCADLLARSNSSEGLSQKEYLEAKIDFIIEMIQNLEQYSLRTEITNDAINIFLNFAGISGDKETKNSKELKSQKDELESLKSILEKLSPEEINTVISQLLEVNENPESQTEYNLSFGAKNNVAKPQKITREGSENKGLSFSDLEYEAQPSAGSLASLSQTEAYRKMSFEEVFKNERGIAFNQEAVEDYAKKNGQLQVLMGMKNRVEQMQYIMTHDKDGNEIKTAPGDLPKAPRCVDMLTSLYGNDSEKITQAIKKILGSNTEVECILDEDGNISQILIGEGEKTKVPLELDGLKAQNLALGICLMLNDNYKAALGGRNLEEYSQETQEAYKKAFGEDDSATTIAEGYVESQAMGVGYLKGAATGAGAVISIAGMLIKVPILNSAISLAGGAFAALGSSGVSYLEATSQEGGMSKQEWNEIKAELKDAIVLMGIGMGIGKVAESAKMATLLTKCPKFLEYAIEGGVDASLSLLADLAVTGEIDLTGEGIAQIINVITGIIQAKTHCKGNFKVKEPSTDNVVDIAKIVSESGLDKKTIALVRSKPESIQIELSSMLSEAKLNNNQIDKVIKFANENNIEQLGVIIKKENPDIIIEILETNPTYQQNLMNIAIKSDRQATDLFNISNYMKKYPEYANDIEQLTISNPNIKVGCDSFGEKFTDIDDIVNCLKNNPNYYREIMGFMSVQRRASNDTRSATQDINVFIDTLGKYPEQVNIITKLANNPNLDASDISSYMHASKNRFKDDSQYMDDVLFFASKKYTESDINRNIALIRKYPELRNIIVSEAPKYKLIDNEPTKTSPEIIKKRFSIREDLLEKVAPEELETLKKTLGNDFYHKVKWEEIIPENATPSDIKSILKTLNEESKFFARTSVNEKNYGKNIQWAHEMNIISETAAQRISDGESFDEVMSLISDNYSAFDKSTTLDSNYYEPGDRRKHSGVYRGSERSQSGNYFTDFDKQGSYQEYYDRFKNAAKFSHQDFLKIRSGMSVDSRRKTPYDDIKLTEICMEPQYMIHPDKSSVVAGMKHIEDRYDELTPLFEKVKNGGTLTKEEIKTANEKISEMYFLMANIMPYERGSNGISDIFMRSVYKSLGIDQPALKQGISLDLEAFCMDMDEFTKQWGTFFEE